MRRPLTVLAVLLVCTVSSAGWGAGRQPALAQPSGSERNEPGGGDAIVGLALEAFPAVLEPGDEQVSLRVRVSSLAGVAPDDVEVVVSAHRRTRSRFGFQQAMDTGAVGARLGAAVEAVEGLPGTGSRMLRIDRQRADLGLPRGMTAGVYPLQVGVVVDGERVEELTTSIVVTSEEAGPPLRTAFLLPFDAPPTVLPPEGTAALVPDPARTLAAVGPDSRLRALLAAAQGPNAFPVTVASSPRLLEELAAAAAPEETSVPAAQAAAQRFLADLGELVERPGVGHLALPYGPADLVAMVRGGLELEAVRHLSIAAEVSQRHLGDAPLEGVVWPPDGLDQATMAEAVTAAGDVVVLGEQQLAIPEGRELPASPSPVRALRTSGAGAATVLVPDPWLSATLTRPPGLGAAVDAQRILAETAALYFERPFAEDVRGLLLAPPQLWAPPEGFAAALLSRLAAAPWLDPVDLERLAATVEPELRPVRLDYPQAARARELPQSLIAELGRARGALGSLATLLPAGSPIPPRFDRRLLTAAAVHYRPAPRRSEATALVRSVETFADPLFDAVTVNDGLQLILPGTQGTIPVSISNSSSAPLRVVVRLGASARRNLDLAEGPVEPVVLAASSTTTLPFEAQVRTPGATFPIDVVVTDVGGTRVLSRGQLVVRSTATSPVALVVTGGAMLFLLAWWLRAASGKRHQRRQPGPAPQREPVHQ